MKLPGNILPAMRQMANGAQVRCATCGARPEVMDVEHWPLPPGVVINFRCHGAIEPVFIERGDSYEMLRSVPRRVFLRRWASHGLPSEAARRGRQMRALLRAA